MWVLVAIGAAILLLNRRPAGTSFAASGSPSAAAGGPSDSSQYSLTIPGLGSFTQRAGGGFVWTPAPTIAKTYPPSPSGASSIGGVPIFGEVPQTPTFALPMAAPDVVSDPAINDLSATPWAMNPDFASGIDPLLAGAPDMLTGTSLVTGVAASDGVLAAIGV